MCTHNGVGMVLVIVKPYVHHGIIIEEAREASEAFSLVIP